MAGATTSGVTGVSCRAHVRGVTLGHLSIFSSRSHCCAQRGSECPGRRAWPVKDGSGRTLGPESDWKRASLQDQGCREAEGVEGDRRADRGKNRVLPLTGQKGQQHTSWAMLGRCPTLSEPRPQDQGRGGKIIFPPPFQVLS